MTDSNNPTILTRKQAKKLGLKRYYTGKPCKYGHKSERHVTNGGCIYCLEEYYKNNKDKWILTPEERVRMNTGRREFYKNNQPYKREKMNVYQRKYYKDNREKCNTASKKWELEHPQQKAETSKRSGMEYRKNNQEKIVKRRKDNRQKDNDRSNKRYKEDTQFRLSIVLRKRLYVALKKKSKKGSAVKLLGCSIEDFMKYFESLFQEGMAWDNHGKWHIDHIIPLAAFDLEDTAQLANACHYTNLQPLWAKDNIIKGDKILS